jgi:FkbM family methyltransferase
MNILDIGANDGWWYNQTKTQYPNANFVLIEANSNNEPALKLLNVPYHIVCLSDCVKEVEFYITTDSPTTTGASYYLENTEHFNESNIQILNLTTTTLDLLFPNETFDIIKLDVQGSEVDIINGGQNLIQRATEIILEVPKPGVVYNIGAPSREMYFDVMYKAGFTMYDVLSEINNLQEDIRFTRS